MKIDGGTEKYLENLGAIIKPDRLIFNIKENKVIIPSRKYPVLKGEDLQVFFAGNTENLEDVKVEEIYNSLDFVKGRCYDNSYKLVKALKDAGVDEVESYAGWIMVNKDYPLHHCFVVYKDKYILDPSVDNDEFFAELANRIDRAGERNREKQREIYIKLLNEKENLGESKRTTFGKSASHVTYFATKCGVEEARSMFRELTKAYPNHEAYSGEGLSMGKLSRLQTRLNK